MRTKAKPPLRSGELAELAGISADTLRLYERKGLLVAPPRSSNGYRYYPAESVDRMRLIRAALSIGFTLDELAEILAMRDGGSAPCAHVRELAGTKLKNLERYIGQLVELRNQLALILKQWDGALKKVPRGKRAGLLEALAADSRTGGRRWSPQLYSSLAEKSIHKERTK
jgi:DNA-binding transcriptional MerR regulator